LILLIYQKLKNDSDPESVHLADWPNSTSEINGQLISDMQQVRDLVSLGLEFRQSAGVKVRQPLAKLLIKNNYFSGRNEYLQLIKDELNVKEIDFNPGLESEVWLDTEITYELREEGMVRERIRQIQERRKTLGLMPREGINLVAEVEGRSRELMERFEGEIKAGTTIKNIDYSSVTDEEIIWIEEQPFKVKIIKL
jgi:isoleucyl-tRNA synthetase